MWLHEERAGKKTVNTCSELKSLNYFRFTASNLLQFKPVLFTTTKICL